MDDHTLTLTDAGADALRLQADLAAAYRSVLALPHDAWMQLDLAVRNAALRHLAAERADTTKDTA